MYSTKAQPDSVMTTLQEVQRRMRTLETATTLRFSSIRGGFVEILDDQDRVTARLGKMNDGSDHWGLWIKDPDEDAFVMWFSYDNAANQGLIWPQPIMPIDYQNCQWTPSTRLSAGQQHSETSDVVVANGRFWAYCRDIFYRCTVDVDPSNTAVTALQISPMGFGIWTTIAGPWTDSSETAHNGTATVPVGIGTFEFGGDQYSLAEVGVLYDLRYIQRRSAGTGNVHFYLGYHSQQ